MRKTIYHRILATTALCLAAAACFGCDTICADSSISARLKQEEEILTPVKDHASARKAAKLLNALEKSTTDYFLPACDPRMAKLNEISARLKQEEEILTPVKDHASARKAATLLKALGKSTTDYFLPACDPRMAKLNELSKQLEDAYYYGCPALARAMGADWQDAIIPTAVSSVKLRQMKKAARNNISRYLTSEQLADVGGGPGFSAEEAWILRTTEPISAGELSDRIALYAVADSRSYTCREVITGERRYNVYTVVQISKDTKHLVEQWVDCTASRKVYPEAERKSAMQELLNRYRTIHGLLMGIHDKDSALAAVEIITPLVATEEHEQLCRIAETSYTMWGFFNIILTEEQLKAYLLQEKNMEKSGYYGVDSLRELLFTPPCQ